MKRLVFLALCLCMLTPALLAADLPADTAKNWPQWRGPEGTGVAPHGDPPTEWSETKNVRWKIEIPGKGHASPVIWGDQVFVLTAVPSGPATQPAPPPQPGRGGRRGPRGVKPSGKLKFKILSISRRNGAVLWERTVREAMPHEGTHTTGTWASSSPVTDGEHVFAYFGSQGLYCFDMKGTLKWDTDLGDMSIKMSFGEGSTPALHGNTLVINWDHEGQSFIIALDKRTGTQIWKVDRDEQTSWSTPLIVEQEGGAQVIVAATGRTRAYDLKNGKVLWSCGGMTRNVIPTPVETNGIVYVMSGFRGNALQAIRLAGAKGDIAGTKAIVWQYDGKATPYTPSPLLYGDKLYFATRNDQFLSCFGTVDGKEHYVRQKLQDVRGVYSSPVGASGRIYVPGRNGVTVVVKQGATYELLAANKLDDGFNASPAIVGKELYLRGKNLYCIAKP